MALSSTDGRPAAMTRDSEQRDDPWRREDDGGQQPTSLDHLVGLRPFTAAEDRKGHDAVLSSRVPKQMARLFQELAFSRATPYATLSDAIRDAIYLGWHIQRLRYPDSLSEACDGEAKALELAIEIAEDITVGETVRRVADDLYQLEACGELDRAVQRLTEYTRLVAAFGDQWRRRRFLHHLRGHAAVRALAGHVQDEGIQALLLGGGG
jgi:hypothetical protein